MSNARSPRQTAVFLGLAALAASGLGCHSRDNDPPRQAAVAPGDAASQAVQAALARYDVVSRQGSAAEKCAQAGAVVDAQTNAHNTYATTEWKAKQAADCSAVVSPALADT